MTVTLSLPYCSTVEERVLGGEGRPVAKSSFRVPYIPMERGFTTHSCKARLTNVVTVNYNKSK